MILQNGSGRHYHYTQLRLFFKSSEVAVPRGHYQLLRFQCLCGMTSHLSQPCLFLLWYRESKCHQHCLDSSGHVEETRSPCMCERWSNVSMHVSFFQILLLKLTTQCHTPSARSCAHALAPEYHHQQQIKVISGSLSAWAHVIWRCKVTQCSNVICKAQCGCKSKQASHFTLIFTGTRWLQSHRKT